MHSADEPCVIRSRAARGNSRGEKAVGEAVSFPYRLITNHRLDFATIYGRGGGVGRGLGDGIGLGVGFGVCVAVAVAVAVGVGEGPPWPQPGNLKEPMRVCQLRRAGSPSVWLG